MDSANQLVLDQRKVEDIGEENLTDEVYEAEEGVTSDAVMVSESKRLSQSSQKHSGSDAMHVNIY
jgi:hypothetical protein